MPKKATNKMPTKSKIFISTAANLHQATKSAPKAVSDRVSRAQSDVAEKRKRAQVQEDVLRMRLR